MRSEGSSSRKKLARASVDFDLLAFLHVQPGDLPKGVGADVIYLTPIFKAYSNHKYDTLDYTQVSPEFGTRQDLLSLIEATHAKGMRLMLDGVFNHMAKRSPAFIQAQGNPKSRYADWFKFGAQYKNGYRAFANVPSLPAINLESADVQNTLWVGKDSIVRRYLKDGIDGWRLDVAFDMGPAALAGITKAAHQTKPGSAVVGEISGYPANWFDSLDGVFNFTSQQIAARSLSGELPGGRAGMLLNRLVQDAGIENLLKSWLLIDNHDTPRATHMIPDATNRRLVQALQLTLPGSPVIYYGTELGMEGGGDPECRAPMRWDLATEDNADLKWVKQWVRYHQTMPALKIGDFRALDTDKLLAFSRTTGKLRESVLVVLNPTDSEVTETFSTRIGRLMSWGGLKDLIGGSTERSINGLMKVTVKPHSIMLLVPDTSVSQGYSSYERIP